LGGRGRRFAARTPRPKAAWTPTGLPFVAVLRRLVEPLPVAKRGGPLSAERSGTELSATGTGRPTRALGPGPGHRSHRASRKRWAWLLAHDLAASTRLRRACTELRPSWSSASLWPSTTSIATRYHLAESADVRHGRSRAHAPLTSARSDLSLMQTANARRCFPSSRLVVSVFRPSSGREF
jgi:hypothetical protein